MMDGSDNQKPVKSVLITSQYYPPHVGGISKYMSSMVAALGPARICCLTGARAQGYSDANSQGVGIYRRPLAFVDPKYVQAVGWVAAVAEILIRERPKAVQLATLYEGYLGLWMRRWMGMPYVVYAHGNEILDAVQAEWGGHRLAIRSADCVFANSHYTVDLLKKAGVQPERIQVVHPGCDVDKFRPIEVSIEDRRAILGPHAEKKVILTVGRLVTRKGHDLVIRALPRVLKAHPETCYLIAGSGPAKQAIARLADEMGLGGKVLFFENLNDSDLVKIYNLCDVFVMPSRADLKSCDVEGFGIVFIEANACGKPVIAGRSGGMADAVVDGVTGFLVDPDDPDALAESLSRMIRDSSFARRIGQQGRDRAVREFTWSLIATRVDEIMKNIVLGNKGMARPENSVKGDGV